MDPSQRRWRDAAGQAPFRWLVPVAPQPLVVWAGGFSTSGPVTTALGVSSRCAGVDVDVQTEIRFTHGARTYDRMMLHDALLGVWHGLDEVELPVVITLAADDRVIDVDGEPHAFTGIRRTESGRWIGVADIADVTVTVTVARALAGLRLQRSTDTSLPEVDPETLPD